MTLDEKVLQRVAEWRPPAGRQTLHLPDAGSGWSLALTADRNDELGSLAWELTLRRSAPQAGLTLADWAHRVAGRVTGLLEPLKVVEIDPQRQEALVRSTGPTQRGDRLFYYEVLLKGTREAEVRRFRASSQPGERREQVAFALTHEALAKLVADVTADR